MKIDDGKGNTFNPSKDQERLYKAGWRITKREKRGMMWIVKWIDPLPNGDKTPDGRNLHEVHPQGFALQIQKDRDRRNKI